MNSGAKHSIRTIGLNIGYQQKTNQQVLLKNLNLVTKPGNLVALVGENGSGKSTLLRTLLNLHPSISGSIQLFNKNISSYSLNHFAKTISFVSTENIRIQNLSVYNLVALGRFPYTNWLGVLTKEDKNIILQSLELVDMLKYKDKNINEISDGERQRALIARTLAQNTPITLLDEPTSFLDLPNKYEIVNLLHNLAKNQQKTIIFSTHDLHIALQEADTLWLIQNKEIIEGCPEDLILNGIFTKLFDETKLNFNAENGEFGIQRNFIKELSLQGYGEIFFWTKKALNRSGIEVSDNKNNNISIEIEKLTNNITWKIINNKQITEVQSIQKLLETIQNM